MNLYFFNTPKTAEGVVKRKLGYLIAAIEAYQKSEKDLDEAHNKYLNQCKKCADFIRKDLRLIKYIFTFLIFKLKEEEELHDFADFYIKSKSFSFNDLLCIIHKQDLIANFYDSCSRLKRNKKKQILKNLDKLYLAFLYLGLAALAAIIFTFLGSSIAALIVNSPATMLPITNLLYKIFFSVITVCSVVVISSYFGRKGTEYFIDNNLERISARISKDYTLFQCKVALPADILDKIKEKYMLAANLDKDYEDQLEDPATSVEIVTNKVSESPLNDVSHNDDVPKPSISSLLTSPIQPSNCVIS